MSDKNKYNQTLFLPKTSFSMRAKLPEQEPKTIKFWNEISLLEKLKKQANGKEKFVLHDGPPYANGPIHMGTATNKILKDIINRTMLIEGYNVLFVPGWDCHGLPIEWQIEKKIRNKGKNKDDIPIKEFRQECRNFANKWIEEQKKSFIRVFVMADWKEAYLTMDYEAEATILEEFAKFFLNGSVYRGYKPVMWSPVEKTALAEAEIEYKNIDSSSIYVLFKIEESKNSDFNNANILIWTTTPWTIPGNRGLAFGKELNYCLLELQDSENKEIKGKKIVIASNLVEAVTKTCGIEQYKVLKSFKGKELESIICRHPFENDGYDFEVPLLEANFVDDKEGTGIVHIAPCYGEDDYNLGIENNIKIEDIVEDNGIYKENTPLFAGLHVFKANDVVIKELKARDSLVGIKSYNHSYPHSWRSKKPIIFRTTPQWFISLEKNSLREKAIRSINQTKWIPSSSKNRIESMVVNRPDWCVSRQRSWGVPITIFINKKTKEPLKDKNVMDKIIEDVKKYGSDVWIAGDPYKYLGDDYDPNDYEVVKDILDVWFDSGSTHAFVLEKKNLKWPADLYLEGTDQHRGFFQSSLLEACGTRDTAPYKAVITHGFVLDSNGRKMSKSLGNVVSPEDIIKRSGADVLRLWAALTDYSEDMRIGDEILDNLNDYYRRIRNTFRFILGNIGEQSLPKCIDYNDLEEIDKYILARIYNFHKKRSEAISDFSFHNFYKALFEFCSVDLSAFYFDISKDALYCEGKNSKKRNAKTTILFYLYDFLASWYSPILCHTMEEVWKLFKTQNCESVHLKPYPSINEKWKDDDLLRKWDKLKLIRKAVNSLIEKARSEKKIGSSLELEVYIDTADKEVEKILRNTDMKEICIISGFNLETYDENIKNVLAFEEVGAIKMKIWISKSVNGICLRCWQRCKEINNKNDLCNRCSKVINDVKNISKKDT
tara:strand:+ start:501 stop:3329 length:2829 start_codon:yes stop_codon:yes gene_type:complete